MNVTPKTHAVQVRKAAERKVAFTPDVRRLAFTSETGVVRQTVQHVEPINAEPNGWDYDDAFCFVCGRVTNHVWEHDDLVQQGRARYEGNSVYRA